MARTFIGGTKEDTNFQKAVADESELRGKAMTTYSSSEGIKKYRYLYNADTVSKAAGLPMCYTISNTSYYGNVVDQPTTGNLSHFAGVMAETVTSGTWGWVQTWGYNSAVPCYRYGSATNANGVANDWLGVANGVDALLWADATDDGPTAAFAAGNAIKLTSTASHGTSTTTSNCTVFIRGMFP